MLSHFPLIDFLSVSLPTCYGPLAQKQHSLSMDDMPKAFPCTTVAAFCPGSWRVQPGVCLLAAQRSRGWLRCAFLLERNCEYALRVSMGTTRIFIIGQSLHLSSDLDNCFLEEEEY